MGPFAQLPEALRRVALDVASVLLLLLARYKVREGSGSDAGDGLAVSVGQAVSKLESERNYWVNTRSILGL